MIYAFDENKHKIELYKSLYKEYTVTEVQGSGGITITAEDLGETTVGNWFITGLLYRSTHGGQTTIQSDTVVYGKSSTALTISSADIDDTLGQFVSVVLERLEELETNV